VFNVLVVNAASPAKSLRELIELASTADWHEPLG
jgi:hypothetical protein